MIDPSLTAAFYLIGQFIGRSVPRRYRLALATARTLRAGNEAWPADLDVMMRAAEEMGWEEDAGPSNQVMSLGIIRAICGGQK